jgi:hypothetical protein
VIQNIHIVPGAGNLDIIRELVKEGLRMPHRTSEAVYFDPYTNRLGFGEPFIISTSPDDPFKVGELAALDLENVDCARDRRQFRRD